jgi:hypothetical protein
VKSVVVVLAVVPTVVLAGIVLHFIIMGFSLLILPNRRAQVTRANHPSFEIIFTLFRSRSVSKYAPQLADAVLASDWAAVWHPRKGYLKQLWGFTPFPRLVSKSACWENARPSIEELWSKTFDNCRE